MKKKYRNSIFRLVVIHLLLLAYPLVSKMSHAHHAEHLHDTNFSEGFCFIQHEDPCPVCDFEFYNFVPATQITTSVAIRTIPVLNSPTPNNYFGQSYQFFSPRAPPVA